MRRLHQSIVPTASISIAAFFLYALGGVASAILLPSHGVPHGPPLERTLTAGARNAAANSAATAAAALETETLFLAPLDTFLSINSTNHSNATTLATYTWPDNQMANAILMKFDLSVLPAGAVVTEATLQLALVGSDTAAETYTVAAHKMVGKNPDITRATGFTADGVIAWTPNSCCSGGVPLAQADISLAYDTQAIDKAPGFKAWTITTMVQEWLLEPAANFGLVLNSDAFKPRDRYRTFASMQHSDSNLRPFLKVTFVAADVAPPAVVITTPPAGDVSGTVPLAATATDNVAVAGVRFQLNGAPVGSEVTAYPYVFNWDTTSLSDGSYTLAAVARDWAGNAASSPAVNVAVKNGVLRLSPQDTYLNLGAANYSSDTTLATYTWPDFKVANAVLMKFDLSAVPSGAVVQEATLFLALVQSDATATATYTVTANKILGKNAVIAQATGYTADGATAWTPNACCNNGVPMAQADISLAYNSQAINKTPGLKSWTITPMLQEWLADPSTNFGLLLNSDASKARDRYRFFASMEHPDSSLRPFLRVVYAPPSGDTTPPAVSIASPAGGAAVSGTITVAANASDDVGVAGVQFRLDGANLGAEDTSPPYSVSWNTATAASGGHSLVAVARDGAGNVTSSALVTVTVGNDATPPVISSVVASSVTASGATIGWSTNEASDSQVEYGTTTMYGSTTPVNTTAVTSHVVALSGLTGTSLYHFRVRSRDTAGNLATSGDFTFTTRDGTSPSVSIASPASGATVSGTITVAANASDNVGVAGVQFRLGSANLGAEDTTPPYSVSWNTTTAANGARTLTAVARDAAGNVATSPGITVTVANDTTPPVISSVVASAITASGASIGWSTNEASDSQVEYGTTTAYGSTTPVNATAVTAHVVAVSGLAQTTQYHLRVRSRDPAGNLATSANFTFTTRDGTAPAVSITAPVGGATVSGTVTVAAAATDNVGVAGVQFKLDGANLGAEDTASAYSVSWNTAAAANGSHTLTATARDAAGNVRTSAGVTVTVSNSAPPPSGGIAALYPGDVGIENHASVVLVERFDESTMTNLFSKWTDVLNGPSMSFSTDAPAGSPAGKSLDIPWSGASSGGHLYKELSAGVDDTLYVRYYIKYPTNNAYNHTGIWMGGSNPALGWPNPQAGTKPAGNDRFIAAAEQNTQSNRFDHYAYWMGMRQSSDGNYWGNLLLNNPNVQANLGQWMCVEHMVKLNSPVTSLNGEHAIWLDGVKVSHLGQGFPNGTWSGGIFTQAPGGSPFPGFQWRNTASLNLNWIWLQTYATSGSGSIKYAHVVAAKSYIGCLAQGSSGDTTLPAVSMSAPAGGATVSGSAVTTSANASDNVGVTGVQFKRSGVNLGAEDTTAPYAVSWNTTTIPNGSQTITAVARDAAGNTRTSAGVTVTVNNTVNPSPWPNEPAGFHSINDQPWNALTGNGWNYLRRTASKDANIVSDPAAPFSPSNALRMVFTTDMSPDSEPSVHWMGLPQPREVYVSWWMKVSPNWQCSPAGCGKVTFLWAADGQGQVYSNIYHSAAGDGASYRFGINTEWAPYGQKIWMPNVTTTQMNPGEWYRIEWYVKYASNSSTADGVMRWWVNGVLNGAYTDVRFPGCCFQQFEFAPTLQNPPPAEQYMYIDHTYVSTP